MKTRILLFDDEAIIRRPLAGFLRKRGYEVLDFPSPLSCALVAEQMCECPRDHACADMVITDMNMPGMTGLELIRRMAEQGCRVPPRNKLVISSNLTAGQEAEFLSLGCQVLLKPFQLDDLLQWVEACERNIPPGRKLAPVAEISKTVRAGSL